MRNKVFGFLGKLFRDVEKDVFLRSQSLTDQAERFPVRNKVFGRLCGHLGVIDFWGRAGALFVEFYSVDTDEACEILARIDSKILELFRCDQRERDFVRFFHEIG